MRKKSKSGVGLYWIATLILHAICLPLVLFYTKLPITPYIIPLFYAFAPITLGMTFLYIIIVLEKERFRVLLYILWFVDCLSFTVLFVIRGDNFDTGMFAQWLGWIFILGNYAIFAILSSLQKLHYVLLFVCGIIFPIGLIALAVYSPKAKEEFKGKSSHVDTKNHSTSSHKDRNDSSSNRNDSSSYSSSRSEMYDGYRNSGYIEDNKIYDTSNHQTGTVINSKVYDENMNQVGYMDDDNYHPL